MPGIFFMALQGLFSTPLYQVSTDERLLAAEITRICLDHENEQYQKQAPPQGRIPGVFESRFDFLTWEHEPIKALRSLILNHLNGVIAVVGEKDPEETRQYPFNYHSWFHVTRNGGYFRPHSHPLASWSAVFCADPGNAPNDGHNEGHLVFHDPRHHAAMYMDRSSRDARREFSFNALKYKLAYGDMVIFPSYLTHFVEPYRGDVPRVTVAVNFWINEFAND